MSGLQGLPILAVLLQTSVLALLSAATPLGMTMASTIFAITREGRIVRDPSLVQVQEASSVHVMAFSSQGDLLLNQSEGEFTMDQWDEVYAKAEVACRGSEPDGGDVMKDIGEGEAGGGMMEFIKTVIEEKVESDLHWRT
jgi:exosome complex component RRP46